ncbi:MAG: hypothetical protein IJF95_02085 [Erysipelotrichaceae bacterium]|nr:hypothetical protein [Erysipelotrichaceae bacterium]
MELKHIYPVFVKRMPRELNENTLYICLEGRSMVHLCPCGCGNVVVLPLDKDYWSFEFDGESISLRPSIGNFQFPCKSHYWIDKNCVRWALDSEVSKKKRRVKYRFIDKLKSLFNR